MQTLDLRSSNRPTFNLGLIGHPLGHSLSPKIHTAALEACDLQGNYSLFPIQPNDKQGLKDLLTRIRSGEIHGLNVTIPHKQTVLPFLDELTPIASAIGAVNTIYLREHKVVGDNTDAAGFLSDLNHFIADRKSQIVNPKSVIVLGAGGSARAVVHALLNDGWNVTLTARRLEQAEYLICSFPNFQVPITAFTNLQTLEPSTFDLIVNTTPIGMIPNVDRSPLPDNLSLPPHVAIYDLVYNPRETRLVRDARTQGLHATTGLGMLIEQAALSFELWTGFTPPRDVLYASVAE